MSGFAATRIDNVKMWNYRRIDEMIARKRIFEGNEFYVGNYT